MKKKSKWIYISVYLIGVFFMLFWFWKRKKQIPLWEFKKICMEMAKMDDEISRNELEGNYLQGKEITFPPQKESIKFRYDFFCEIYKKYSRKKLEEEKLRLENRLKESQAYKEQVPQDLEFLIEY